MPASMIVDAQDAAIALLFTRAAKATVCPSEVARTLARAGKPEMVAENWRTLMPIVHAAVDQLVAHGRIQLSWKGKVSIARDGPYRIGRP